MVKKKKIKLISWNVNGIRAAIKKDFFKLFNYSLRLCFTQGSPGDTALFVGRNHLCAAIKMRIGRRLVCQRTSFKKNLYTDTSLP